VTIAPTAAAEVAHGAPVYAPGVLAADDGIETDDLLACYTPDGAVVCLGRLVGDPDADRGEVVELERVLV
jgi:tRNA pseudouridine55 synthase